MDFKIRIETDDGDHVWSATLTTPVNLELLTKEIHGALLRYPRRKTAGLTRKTNMLKEQE